METEAPLIIDPDIVQDAKRKVISIALSEPVLEIIEGLREDLVLVGEDGKERPYPRSYLIEDVLVFVFSNDDLFERFLDYLYEDEEDEEED